MIWGTIQDRSQGDSIGVYGYLRFSRGLVRYIWVEYMYEHKRGLRGVVMHESTGTAGRRI